MGGSALCKAQMPLAEANCTDFYAPDPAMDPEYGEVPKHRSSFNESWGIFQAFGGFSSFLW